jgi:hypothetical protein
MPAVSADRPDGDEGSGQGQAPDHPYIDVTTVPSMPPANLIGATSSCQPPKPNYGNSGGTG